MAKILFPTDFSEAANKAYIYALHLANKMNAELLVVHTYKQPNFKTIALPNTLKEVYASIELEEFEDFKNQVPVLKEIEKREGLENVNVKHALREGETIPSLLSVIRAEAPDLVVMGTKGATGLRELFIGSVTGEVMENAVIPVLGVPMNANFGAGIKKILYLTNFAEEEKKALKRVTELATLLEAEVHCLHADLQHTPFAKERMEKWKATIALDTEITYKVVDALLVERTVVKYVEENEIDAVAMLTHKRNFFKELFLYSLTKQLSYHLKTPVLAIQSNSL